ncbi:MAG: KH domain-containing protein [Erysipelotrichia bacterium]|nr:KH domain-containing protein [Erysipelotrichia bacterium]
MKTYSGKTVEEALQTATSETGVAIDDLIYIVSDKKKGLFNKKIVVEVYDMADVIVFAEDYILGVIDALEIESTVNTSIDEQVIKMTIDSNHNPILIGRNGRTLQALNVLVKLAVSNHFHRRFRVLLDINGYKDSKYSRLVRMARRYGHEIQRTRLTFTFDPMPADERRAIHNALNNMANVRTESIGEGANRQVQIIYVE